MGGIQIKGGVTNQKITPVTLQTKRTQGDSWEKDLHPTPGIESLPDLTAPAYKEKDNLKAGLPAITKS